MKLGNITIDCDDVMKVATFWSAVLERPLDEGSFELFASIGGTDAARVEPAWYFAKVPEAKSAKNRMHVDLTSPDPDAVDRLVALGAAVVGEHELPGEGHRWTVMRDPEGNEFCVAENSFTGWS
jgi:predicted enzyme related to lactoylglutathione lyase